MRRQQKLSAPKGAPFVDSQGRTLSLEQALFAGSQLHQQGRIQEAENIYQKVLSLSPEHPDALNLLGNIRHQQKRLVEARSLLERSVAQNPQFASNRYHLGCVYKDLDLIELAISSLSKALEIDPNHSLARNQLSALTGDTEHAVQKDYVARLFDEKAEEFEDVLVDKLGYITYKKLWGMVQENTPDRTFSHMLDLGCGTGLMAKEIGTFAQKKIGVDISSGILEQARKQNLYDELYTQDLENYLSELKENQFDLITSADVFVYLGELSEIFKNISRTLTQDGLFAFSCESAEEHDTEKDFIVHKANRFAHSKTYLDKILQDNNLNIISYQSSPLRKEGGKDVIGHCYIASH